MGMHIGRILFLFFAGVIGGTMNAVAGGGSFITFPALLFTGVNAVEANATNTVALWPGLGASMLAYFHRLNAPLRLLTPLLVASLAGGWAGAWLLLHTPQQTFLELIPWLLLGGTLLFAFGNQIRALAGKASAVDDLGALSLKAIIITSIVMLVVAVYGGYFGAGLGFILMGMLAGLGMREVHAMAAIRTLIAAAVNAAAVVTFIVAKAVLWPQWVVMVAGALSGGWFGARFAQRVDPQKVRLFIIGLGLLMSVYFFWKYR